MSRSRRAGAALLLLVGAAAAAAPADASASGLAWNGARADAGLRAAGDVAYFAQTVYEVTEGATLTAHLVKEGPSDGSVTLNAFSAGEDTASPGDDYGTPSPAGADLPAGPGDLAVQVPIPQDTIDELDVETFKLCWNPAPGSSLHVDRTNCTRVEIADDDAPSGAAAAVSFSSAGSGHGEHGGTDRIAVTKTGQAAGSVTLTIGGSATRGLPGDPDVDYRLDDPFGAAITAPTRTLSFGTGHQTIELPLTFFADDDSGEGTEFVDLSLSSPSGIALGPVAEHTVSIIDSSGSPRPQASLGFDQRFLSGPEDDRLLEFPITKTGGPSGTVTFALSGLSGGGASPATVGDDVALETTASVIFDQAGTQTKVVRVRLKPDSTPERVERAVLSMVNPVGGLTLDPARSRATVEVTDDDPPTPPEGEVAFIATARHVTEGAATQQLVVRKTGPATGSVTVHFGGTAERGTTPGTGDWNLVDGDQASNARTVTFDQAGTQTRTIAFAARGDDAVDDGEYVLATLGGASGLDLGSPTQQKITIDDVPPPPPPPPPTSVAFVAASSEVTERDEDLLVSVTKTGPAATTVPITVTPGPAAPPVGAAGTPSDYVVTQTDVTFAAGETSKTVTVDLEEDAVDEPDEQMTLALGAPSGGATVGAMGSHVVRILDDDDAPPPPPPSTSTSTQTTTTPAPPVTTTAAAPPADPVTPDGPPAPVVGQDGGGGPAGRPTDAVTAAFKAAGGGTGAFTPAGTVGGAEAFLPQDAEDGTLEPGADGTLVGPGVRATQDATAVTGQTGIGDGTVTIASASRTRTIRLKTQRATLRADQVVVIKGRLSAAQRKAIKRLRRPRVAVVVTVARPGASAVKKRWTFRLRVR